MELGIDLGGRAFELHSWLSGIGITKANQLAVAGRSIEAEGVGALGEEGIGAGEGSIGIADRKEAQTFAKTGRDRAGRIAGGVGENRITHRLELKTRSGEGSNRPRAIIDFESEKHCTRIDGLQGDRRIGQQVIDLGQGASHLPVVGRAEERERGAATVRANAEAAEVGVGRSQEQLGGGAVVGQIGIGHADRRGADQALQAGDDAMAQAYHGADDRYTAEHGRIIHRRHVDRGVAEVQAGAARSQIKAQAMVAIGLAGGGEVENATGLQIGIQGTDRAHQGQLGAAAPRNGDTRAITGAEAATEGAALAHR